MALRATFKRDNCSSAEFDILLFLRVIACDGNHLAGRETNLLVHKLNWCRSTALCTYVIRKHTSLQCDTGHKEDSADQVPDGRINALNRRTSVLFNPLTNPQSAVSF